MRLILVWTLIGVLLSAMAGGLLKEKSIFDITGVDIEIEVKDSDRIAWKSEIAKVEAALKVFKGNPLWKVSLVDVQRALEAIPSLEKVQVQKNWPQNLEVKYSLPALKAIYPIGENKFQILTERGKWVGPVNWSRLPSLPWVRGNWVDRKSELQTKVIDLLNQLPTKGLLTPDQISEIQFNDVDGFLITLIKTGQQIRFGTDSFEIKSLRANQVLDYLQSKGLESRVIDLNFSKKVLVRLRNQP